jgi:hypothetical protein
MPTLMQKIRLAIRGWSRRREEAEKEFLAKNAWGPVSAGPDDGRLKPAATPKTAIDTEGLTVAYLDESGRIAYYLDTETGEVVEMRDSSALAAPRYRRVPARSEQSEADDRRAFGASHKTLAQSLGSAEDFRRAVSRDRAIERAWYNFKNDRAIAAIEEWLRNL